MQIELRLRLSQKLVGHLCSAGPKPSPQVKEEGSREATSLTAYKERNFETLRRASEH